MVRLAATLAVLAIGGTAIAQNGNIPSPGSGQPLPGNVPILPVANPQQALAKLPVALQGHLIEWEKRTTGLQTLYTECERERTNVVTKISRKYTGAIRCMKPSLAYLRVDNATKKEDFEAYICDGKNVYEYSGSDKTVMKHAIPPGGKGNVGDNLLLEFMSGGMTAQDVASRFNLKLIKEDQYYIYIDVQPLLPKDQKEFDSMILVLFGGGVKGFEYLPAKVRMVKGQETEEWTFKKPMPNAAGIKEADFRYIEPPKDWKVQDANAVPGVKTVRP